MLGHAVLRFAGDQDAGECCGLRDAVGTRGQPESLGDSDREIEILGLAIWPRVVNVQTERYSALLCLFADHFRSLHEVLHYEAAQRQ